MTTYRAAVDAACLPFRRFYKARLGGSPLAARLVRGTFRSLVGTVLSRFLGLLASILVARMIGKVGLGELGIVQSTVGMFSTLAGLGLGLTATKHVAEHRVGNPVLVGETIGLLSLISWGSGLLMTLVILFLSPWLARHSLAAPQLAPELESGSLLLLFGVINGVQTGILSGFEAFKSIARINLVCGLANFPILVGGAYCAGLPGAVWGLVAILALNCGLNFLAVRREATAAGAVVTYRHVHKHWPLLWRFGLPGMLSGLIAGPVNWGTSTLLVNQHGGYAEMGVLNACNTWFQAVTFLPYLLGQVLLPILASYSVAKDRDGLNRALVLATCVNLIIMVPIVAIGCVLSRYIMGFYGPGFVEGWPVLAITLLSGLVLMAQAPITDRLVATSKMWAYFLAHFIWAVVFVLGSYLLVPAHGSAGLALARLLAYILCGVVVLVLMLWHNRGHHQSK
jgi:O-antigen/teichoic acid export membrane protein